MVGKKYVTKDDLEAFARKLIRRITGSTIGLSGSGAAGGGGVSSFLDLNDAPSSYVGEAGNSVRVNAGETGLEFFDLDLDSLSDVDLESGNAPSDGDLLTYDNGLGRWIAAPLAIPSGGIAQLCDLLDVDCGSPYVPEDGDVLIFDAVSGDWRPGSGSGAADLCDLLDVDCGSPYVPEDGDVLIYDEASGDWRPGAAPSGSDPWTYKKLTADFSTDSGVAVDITGLNFTPAANKIYIIEARLLLRTSNSSYGVRIGGVAPGGLDDGVLAYGVGTAAGSSSLLNVGNIGAEWYHALTALPDATYSWPAWILATLVVGASPSGDFQLRVRSETGGITVYVKKGSHLRYREI